MKLELTSRNLRRISEMPDPAIEDVLNFIYDFCHDIKTETGQPIEKLECREEDELYKRLPWLGRTVTKIGREKESQISKPSRLERLQEIAAGLEELDAQLADAAEVQNRCRLERKRLEERKRTLEEEKQQEKTLLAEIEQIKGQIGELEALDFETLNREKETEAKKRAQLFEQLDSLKTEIAQSRSEQGTLQEEINRVKEELSAVGEEIGREKEQQATLQDQLFGQIEEKERLRSECEDLDRQRKNADGELQDLKARCSAIQNELSSEEQQLKKLDAERTLKQVEQLQERLSQLRSLNEKLDRDWNSAWGQEQRELNPDLTAPSEILKKDIAAVKARFHTYRADLQKVIRYLSSDGMQQ